jgi:hypothetical protein
MRDERNGNWAGMERERERQAERERERENTSQQGDLLGILSSLARLIRGNWCVIEEGRKGGRWRRVELDFTM